jgi:photosystem II stability/assembly factor-like uncharacterized protein
MTSRRIRMVKSVRAVLAHIILIGSMFGLYSKALANPTLTPGQWIKLFSDYACALAIDPSNPSTMYLGNNGGSAGIYKTTDGGSNWKRIGKIDGTTDFSNDVFTFVDPNNPQRLYGYSGVRGTNGFWISTDAGNTWSTPPGFNQVAASTGYFINDLYGLATEPENFNHLLLTSHAAWEWGDPQIGNNSGVLESTDGGMNWTVHLPMDGFGYGNGIGFLYNPAKSVGDKYTWLFGSQGSGYWRTTNAGTSWTKLNTTTQTHGGCQVYAASSGAFYVTAYTGIYRSTDVGASWQIINGSNGLPGAYFLGIIGDGNNLYTCGSEGGAFYTSLESDGLTWKKLNNQTFSSGPMKMAYDEMNGIVYASCSPDGLWALKVSGTANVTPKAVSPAPYNNPAQKTVFRNTGNRVLVSVGSVRQDKPVKIYNVNGTMVAGIPRCNGYDF